MPHGGYVPENGISLCEKCHILAEAKALGYEPEQLYRLIGSNVVLAVQKSKEILGDE
jgi:hypothetical protein